MHTQTPLSFEQLANGKVLIEYETRDGIEVIAELVETDLPGRQYADDIVRAVNSHTALVEALEAIMTGGNHLALQITNSFGEHPPYDATFEEAQKFYKVGVPGWGGKAWKYDVWICWRAIMQARQALAQAKGGA